MQDMLRRGARVLAEKHRTYAAEPVTFTRAATSVDLPATFGRNLADARENADRFRTEWAELDFLVIPADLGELFPPAAGDRVTWEGRVYEVMPDDTEDVWRDSDQFGERIRVHAKRVA